jgi:hypothetical protein
VTPTALSGGGTPFPEGDPRNAKYFETLGALEHTLNNTLATDEKTLADARASYNYTTGELDHNLPLKLQTTRNTANAHGLLESGQLAQAAGGVEAKYAGERAKQLFGLQGKEDELAQNVNAAQETANSGRQKAATSALEEGKTELEKEVTGAPAATPAAPKAPAPTVVGQRAQLLTASRAGSAPRAPSQTSAVPRVVGQRAQPTTVSMRRQAAKRVVVG